MIVRRAMLLDLIFFLSWSFANVQLFSGTDRITVQPDRMFKKIRFSSVEKIVKYAGKYFVLEAINHRILVFNSSEELEYQISRIGQERGELFYPRDFVIKLGRLYVYDQKNMRVQIFDLEGNYINSFSDRHNSYGIEVNSRGEIYLGQPDKGKLISVYDKDGKFLKSFGELHKLSDFYGSGLKDMDKKYLMSINRVNICLDRSDNLYLSFVGAPFFQKYDKNGNLIFEKKIPGPEAEQIIDGFRNKRESPVRRSIDDPPTPLITTGITVNDASDTVIIPFQWNRCWIYLVNSDGIKIVTLEPTEVDMLFQNPSLADGYNLILPRLSVIKNNEAYAINLRNLLKGGEKL